MKRDVQSAWLLALAAVGAFLLLGAIALAADEKPGDIDWNRAQQLFSKTQAGENLTPEEREYLNRARQARARGEGPKGQAPKAAAGAGSQGPVDLQRAQQLMQKSRGGEALTSEEQSYLDRAKAAKSKGGKAGKAGPAQDVPPARDHLGVLPIDQMTAQDSYKGEDGGLYGGGKNTAPPVHQAAAAKEAAKIVPLGPDGKPAAGGQIVLLCLGMSSSTMEFSAFMEMANKDPAKSPKVVLVDAAQNGQDAARWNNPDQPTWKKAEQQIHAAGVTPEQVQVSWLKQARITPMVYGEYPKHIEEINGHMISMIQIAKQKYPNLRIIYLSSRTYGGYATIALNTEPYAYETGFGVRRLIQQQIQGDAQLNYDPAKGQVRAPLLLWGPYLWADGVTPRASDGLAWKLEDFREGDRTHPSVASGRPKVAKLLMNFFSNDPTARPWYVHSSK